MIVCFEMRNRVNSRWLLGYRSNARLYLTGAIFVEKLFQNLYLTANTLVVQYV